jgi:hypothetical protein
MAARPTVSVYTGAGEASGSVALPKVFTAPIRLDVVQQVHSECQEPSGRVDWSSRGNLCCGSLQRQGGECDGAIALVDGEQDESADIQDGI